MAHGCFFPSRVEYAKCCVVGTGPAAGGNGVLKYQMCVCLLFYFYYLFSPPPPSSSPPPPPSRGETPVKTSAGWRHTLCAPTADLEVLSWQVHATSGPQVGHSLRRTLLKFFPGTRRRTGPRTPAPGDARSSGAFPPPPPSRSRPGPRPARPGPPVSALLSLRFRCGKFSPLWVGFG